MEGKIRLREDDYINLAALKICSEGLAADDISKYKIPISYYIPL
jgi:hypothetical protein